jgi:hypothetical protein
MAKVNFTPAPPQWPGGSPGRNELSICKWGHPFTKDHSNVYIDPWGRKHCKLCTAATRKRMDERSRELFKEIKPKYSPRWAFDHCKNGHAFTEANTYLRPTGQRACITCKREKLRDWRGNNPEKVKAETKARYDRWKAAHGKD